MRRPIEMMVTTRALMAVAALLATAGGQVGCDAAETPRRVVGDACDVSSECASDLCAASVCVDPDGDDDGDGLTNSVELALGTSMVDADSDGDGLSDPAEVGDPSQPANRDGDLTIDALEHNDVDDDDDCVLDVDDPYDGVSDPATPEQPERCGDGSYEGIDVCHLWAVMTAESCAAGLGQAFLCWDPAGACASVPNGVGQGSTADIVYDNGAAIERVTDASGAIASEFIASNGDTCLRFAKGKFEADGIVYQALDGGVRCADGTTVRFDSSLHGLLSYCVGGGAAECTAVSN